MALTWGTQNDTDQMIVAGLAGLNYAGVIQANDGLGGYNTRFSINGSLNFYHVHFAFGGTQVKVLRFFTGPVAQGRNLLKADPQQRLADIEAAIGDGFPNCTQLIRLFRATITPLPRAANNQLM